MLSWMYGKQVEARISFTPWRATLDPLLWHATPLPLCKQQEEVGSAPLADFLASYFEGLHPGDRTEAQRQLGAFARALQEHWHHPAFGSRVYAFGLLAGLLVFEGDHPRRNPMGGCLGASAGACDLVLDALRALIGAPRFVPPPPVAPTCDTGGSARPWRKPASSQQHGKQARAVAVAQKGGVSSSLRGASSALAGLALADGPASSPEMSTDAVVDGAAAGNEAAEPDYPAALERWLRLRRAGPSSCCVPFQRDAVRRAAAAAASARARVRAGRTKLPPRAREPPLSTGEGRLRRVFADLEVESPPLPRRRGADGWGGAGDGGGR